MATVDYAWSTELGEQLTASEAHEKWLLGEICNKKNFKCIDPDCEAQITCVNMDKHQYQMKVREYFKVYSEHSTKCNEKKRIKERRRKGSGNSKPAPTIEEEITFDLSRPKSSNKTVVTISKKNEVDVNLMKKIKGESSGKSRERKRKRKSHLHLLSGLVSTYIFACKKGRLEKKVKIKYPNNPNLYNISLKKLFVDIQQTEYIKDEEWKTKVYFGKAVINKKSDGEFWVNFNSQFLMMPKKVCCVIRQNIIDNTISRKGALNIINNFLNREVYCFALGTLVEKESIVYINISTLDHFSCTDEDVSNLDDVLDEDD